MQPNEMQQADPQKRYATLMILWGAMFFNIGIFFLLSRLAVADPSALPENRTLAVALMAGGTLLALLSIIFRGKMVARAVEQQRPQSVHTAYIVAFAICESAALFGLLLRFATNERYYYLLFAIAAVGFLANMPRRNDVINASAGKGI
jgi:F0F1-type ATP synthase membrane subunit c/vacuolar-type H+-ATPase subunit K